MRDRLESVATLDEPNAPAWGWEVELVPPVLDRHPGDEEEDFEEDIDDEDDDIDDIDDDDDDIDDDEELEDDEEI